MQGCFAGKTHKTPSHALPSTQSIKEPNHINRYNPYIRKTPPPARLSVISNREHGLAPSRQYSYSRNLDNEATPEMLFETPAPKKLL